MDAVVVDTDVVSFLHKKDSRARLFRAHLVGNERIISFMTLAELELWTLKGIGGQSPASAWSDTCKDTRCIS